jgi:hypothetical protein
MFDNDSSQAKLGRAGETIVLNWFSSQGKQFQVSVDQYDSQKDMIVEGKKVEVKTQVPFVIKNSFSFKENQLRKCLNADYVYFVSVPNEKRPHHSSGKVYCIESSNIKFNYYTTKDGRNMVLIPIDQEGMKEVFTMSENEAKILQRYSVSGWN